MTQSDAEPVAWREREALEFIAEAHDAGRHDGLPELCPAHDAETMWAVAREALQAASPILPHTNASAGLIEAAEIAHALKGQAYLCAATDAGKEGYLIACNKIAEVLRACAADRNAK